MADEEDVVFQNSALHEHLKEVGFTDADIGTEATKIGQMNERINHVATTKWQWKSWVTSVWSRITQRVQEIIAPATILSVGTKQRECVRYIVRNVMSCPTLEDEDAAVITHYTCDLGDDGVKSYDSVSCDTPPWSSDAVVRHPHLWYATLIGGVVVATIAFNPRGLRIVHVHDVPYIVFILSAVAVIHLVRVIEQVCVYTRDVCDLVTAVGTFYRVIRKSIRLIQETELVARGFTMVGDNSAINQLERANLQASRRQCVELRRIVFDACRDCMILFKANTAELLKRKPGTHLYSYMATISLDEYGPCASLPTSSTELKLATDNYSVTALKAMFHLCNAHVSEFLRVFVLTYLTCDSSTSRNTEEDVFQEMFESVQTIQRDFTANFKRVEQAYTLHQCSWPQDTATHADTMLRRARTGCKSSAIYTTVHSLSLHLQAALKRVHGLEVQLEPLCEVDHDDLPVDLLKQLTSELGVIKVNLDACHNCWDDLNHLHSQPCVQHRGADKAGDHDQPEDNEVSPTAPLVDISEPLLVDQMYEAFPDPEGVKGKDKVEESDLLLLKEVKAMKRREKREALRMLSELKGVIALRALERSRLNENAVPAEGTKETTSCVGQNKSESNTVDDGGSLSDSVTQLQSAAEQEGVSNDIVDENDTLCVTGDNISQQSIQTDDTGRTKLAFGLYGTIVVDGAGSSRFSHLDKQSNRLDSSDDEHDSEAEKETPSEHHPLWDDDKLRSPCDGTTPVSGPSVSDEACERPSIGFSFTSDVAMQAVARSRQMAALVSVDVFACDSDPGRESSDESD